MLAAVIGLVPTAEAIVVQLSAEAWSKVTFFVNGAQDSFDESHQVFGPESGLSLPISTQARLETFADGSDPEATGQADAGFDDPTRTTPGRNPEEFTLEAACFSNDDSTGCVAEDTVIEERIIRFSGEELGNPLDGTRRVQSAFFPSGAIFLWSLEAGRDLTGLSAEVSFVVCRAAIGDDGVEEDCTVLLEERVSLRGRADGSIEEDISNGIFAVAGDLSILPDIPDLPLGDLSALGATRFLIIPETQELAYEYPGEVDEEFVLKATVTVVISNQFAQPAGTGGAAAFGSFDQVADVLALAVAESSAKAIQARINRAIEVFEPQAVAETSQDALPNPCGLLGVEVVAMLMLSMAFFVVPRRRGRVRSTNV